MKLRMPKEIIDRVRGESENNTVVQVLLYDCDGNLYDFIETSTWLVNESTNRKRRPRAILEHYAQRAGRKGGYCEVIGFKEE